MGTGGAMTRSGSTPLLQYWVAGRPIPGEHECGDQFVVAGFEGGALAAVIDGLGHGEHAAEAARHAVSVLAAHAGEPVVALFHHCHEALRRMRGVIHRGSKRKSFNSMLWLGSDRSREILR